MSWIRGMLAGLVAALEALVIAFNEDDPVSVANCMRYISDMQKHIEAEWAEMVGALERAEQSFRNLGDMIDDDGSIARHEAEAIRFVLDRQEGDDESS